MKPAGLVSAVLGVVLFLIFVRIPAVAANPALVREWARAWDSANQDSPSDIALGPDGSVYVAGEVRASQLLFVVKYSPLGRKSWSRTLETGSVSISSERPARLAIDGNGNVVLMGTVNNGAGKDQDFMVAKYDPDGIQLWSQSYDDRGDNDSAGSVSVDGAGNVYVSGSVNHSGPRDIVTVKYSPNGVRLWAARYANADDLSCQVLALPDGTVSVLGSTTGFSSDDDILLIRYDSNGAQLWAVHYNGGGVQVWPPDPLIGTDDWPSRMIVDGSGNAYVVGFSQRVQSGSYGIVLLKYSATGELVWTRRHESAIERPQDLGWKPSGLALDPNGDIVVAGRHFAVAGYGWVTLKYDPEGNLLWEQPYYVAGVERDDEPFVDLSVDRFGNAFVLGTVPGTPTYQTDYLTLQYSPDGTLIRGDRFDNGSDDRAGAMVANGSGDLFITGESTQSDFGSKDALTIKYGLRSGPVFPVFFNGELGGVPNSTRIVLTNGGDVPAAGVIRFRDAHGEARPLPLGGKDTETCTYTIPAGGTMDIESDGTGEPATGYIEIVPNDGASPPLHGSAFFSILGNHVSVGDSPPRSTHQIYVSYSGEENTGAALYNLEEVPVTVTASLIDHEGVQKATSQLVIDPSHQISRFVNEAEFFQEYFALNPGRFTGTLHLRVEEGRRVAALGLIQKKEDGALVSMVTSPHIHDGSNLTEPEPQNEAAGVLLFPQYVNGVSGSLLNRTRVVLRNNAGIPDNGEIVFRNADGTTCLTPVSGQMLDRIPYSLPAWATVEFQTDGTGLLKSGYIQVDSQVGVDSGVEGTEVFDLLGSFVSVGNAEAQRFQQVYVSRNSLENTGIAVVYAGQHDPWTKLDATLFDGTGTQVADTELELSFTRQKALLVDEIFKAYFDAHPGDFRGTLTIGGRFFVLGLIQKRSNGALIAVPAHAVTLSH